MKKRWGAAILLIFLAAGLYLYGELRLSFKFLIKQDVLANIKQL
ncbi:hypothetical protein [Fictibacillus terranigra]|uniref:Uncharacterized protein n=1 Tax=Fictibacillus terranigra TaxID=3058424 RepID=A0ABT8E8D0_9BACL|nr:hypothetical protein [Fictibacillus sp. CENA-BCM004]MDN4074173.1 hypothetical protein [Fictibacillus sp. CENA-BCM004]